MASAFVIPTQFTAIDKFSGPVKAMEKSLGGFVGRSERLLGRANKAFSSLMSPIAGLNKMMMGLGYYIGLFTLVRVIKNAIDIFADFEQANADIAAVLKGDATKSELLALADNARKVGLNYGVAATEVVRMQHALATLGFKPEQILTMSGPMIAGSSALEGADPERLADTVGAVINTFNNLGAGDTAKILNIMAKAANETALTFESLATTLPIVSGPANTLRISFEEVVALLGTLSNAGVNVATSGTALKNIFIDSQRKGHSYAQVLQNIANNADKLTYAYKKFGKRSVVSALVLADKLKETLALEEKLIKAGREGNLIDAIAAGRLDTFRGAQKLLNAAWTEFVLSIEDGKGPIAEWLKWWLKVASAVLLLASNTDAAREALKKISPFVIEEAERWSFWIKVIEWFIGILISLKTVLVTWNVLNGVVSMFKIIIGVIGGAASLILGIIAAFIAGVVWFTNAYSRFEQRMISLGVDTLVEKYFAQFGAVIATTFTNIFNSVISMASSIGNVFVKIGTTIIDWMLHPLQLVLEAIGKVSGAKWAVDTAANIYMYRQGLMGHQQLDVQPVVNQTTGGINMEDFGAYLSGKISMDINDPGNHVAAVRSNNSWIMPEVTRTNFNA